MRDGNIDFDHNCEENLFDEAVKDEKPKRHRRRGRRAIRGRTIAIKRITKESLEFGRALYPDSGVRRPQCRADCATVERPCPFVGCKHHLYLDVNPETGSIKLNFPDLEPWELEESCVLDLAERGENTLEYIGKIMNLTRERVRQIELLGLQNLLEISTKYNMKDYC